MNDSSEHSDQDSHLLAIANQGNSLNEDNDSEEEKDSTPKENLPIQTPVKVISQPQVHIGNFLKEEVEINKSHNNSVDSNLKAIMIQEAIKSDDDEIINTDKKSKEKLQKDSIMEELVQAIKEPENINEENERKSNSKEHNTTTLLNNFNPGISEGKDGFGNSSNNYRNNTDNNFRNFNTFYQSLNNNNNNQSNTGFNNNNTNNNYRNNNFNSGSNRLYRSNYQGNRPFNRDFNRGEGDNNGNSNNYYNHRRNYNNYNNNEGNSNNNNQLSSYSNRLEFDQFYQKHRLLIHEIINIFTNISEIDLIRIIKTVNQGSKKTLFEIMNLFYRENSILKTIRSIQSSSSTLNQRIFDDKIDINETAYPDDIITNHNTIIKHYKIHNETQCVEHLYPIDFAYSSSNDQRRSLCKDIDGNYNYLPRITINTAHTIDDYYALNLNEINYHSLIYHTRLCRKTKCNEPMCPDAHDLSDDFRLLYDYRNEAICILMNRLDKDTNCMITAKENYMEHFKIPIDFQLYNFKLLECQMKKHPLLDRHLCPCYHSLHERRRPPGVFRYGSETCGNALNLRDNNGYKPENCPFGDYCPKVHSVYEFNYHLDHFRKNFPCEYEKKDKTKKCPFLKTCYGIHKKNDNGKDDYNDEILLSEMNIKLCAIENIIDNVITCKNCHQLPQDYAYVFYKNCFHYTCIQCFKKCIKKEKDCQGQSDSKCPYCNESFTKKEVFRIFFSNH